jgi:hypothetical protein
MASQEHLQQVSPQTRHDAGTGSRSPSLRNPPTFRSKAARDLWTVLTVNPDVASLTQNELALQTQSKSHAPDFAMIDFEGHSWLLDAPDRALKVDQPQLQLTAAQLNHRYRLVSNPEVYDGYLLQNARDLLRYQGHRVPLGDRVRLLSCLDEHGSLTLSECLQVIRETQAVPALASLILQRLLTVELDSALIGPETMVRRIRT